MSLRVVCPKCKEIHSINRRLLGRSIRCPVCDAIIEVPIDAADTVNQEIKETEVFEAIQLEPLVPSTSRSSDPGRRSDEVTASPLDQPMAVEIVAPPSRGSKGESLEGAREDDDEPEEQAFARRALPKDDMDMTPMVDVTFLLLIFFMITASFTSEKVIEEPPTLSDKASLKAKQEPDKILDTVRVQVDEFNAYTIILPGGEDRQATSKQDLLIALGDARRELSTGANDDDLRLAVEAHTESIHAAVVAALDAGREKGFNSIQVTVVEEFD